MAKYTEDENGYVTFPDTPLARPGVLQYTGSEIDPSGKMDLDPDKVYNVYRPESELNNPETIESFKLTPWFPRHEMAGEGYRGAEEIGVQGTTGQDVQFKPGIGLVATVKTFGNSLKQSIRQGMKELSLGFKCAWEVARGTTPDGIQYDVIQRNIRGNHFASVEEGRAGPEFSVAMDGARIALDNLDDEGQTMTLEELTNAVKEAEFTPDELTALKVKIDEMAGGKESNEEEEREGDDKKAEDKESEDAAKDADNSDEGKEGKDADDASASKDEDKDDAAMDALSKQVKDLQKQIKEMSGNALDAATIESQINEKNALIKDLEPVVGRIDGSGMDSSGVAKKAADILGIACDSKGALSAVRGFLHGRKEIKTTVDTGTAQDKAAATSVTKALDEAGL